MYEFITKLHNKSNYYQQIVDKLRAQERIPKNRTDRLNDEARNETEAQ